MDWKAAVSFVPFTLFVGTAIGLSFWGAIDINLLVGVGISAILVGTFLTKEKGTYWETVFEFMGSKTAMTATLLWLIVGVYGNILKEGHIVEGLVWAAHQLDINATGFTLVVFLFSSLFAVSTGSGFGTISAMSLTLFPAGIALGADPALLGGAILSGAALGDSIAPVSDTAVIAATTQEYADGKESADIGGTVKKRLPLALTALAVALIAYGITGGFHTATSIAALDNTSEHPQGLALLIPTLMVILLSFRKVNIFVALAVGLAVAVGIGLTFNLFTLSSLICVENGKVGGAIVEGIGGMANICILLMMVVSLSGLIIRSGGMDGITGSLNAHVIRSPKGAELAIFGLVSIAGILIAAVNTIANICIAPFVNGIGKQHGLHPYRRTTLLATVICTFPFVLPYGGCVLLLQKGIEASGCGMGIQVTDVFFTAFYPWALLAVMLVVCLTGYQREKNITDERTDETDTK